MPRSEVFVQDLHDALKHLYEPDRLRRSPLARMFGVADQINAFTQLQEILIGSIESLEPSPDAPAQSPAWEIYEPLFYRYVKQLAQSQVAKQLGMSARHLRRKEHVALEVLAANLWEQFDLSVGKAFIAAAGATMTVQGDLRGLTIREELQWLREIAPETPTSLHDGVDEVLNLVRLALEREGVSVRTSLADDLPKLVVHNVALSQVLLNLICVALHQAKRSTISIDAREDAADVVVRVHVADALYTPADLPKDDQAKLNFAEEMAGLGGISLDYAWQAGAFVAELRLPSVGRVPVLVIDDNADTLQLLRRYAIDTRYRVFTSQDPEQAFALIEKTRPRIVVLDVMMPRMDGWKLLGRLRQHPRIGDLPIIVCTVLPQQEIAYDLGASGFVQKPVTRQAFLTALDDQLARMA